MADPQRELRAAEADLRAALHCYDDARREIGNANRTKTEAMIVNGRVVMPAKPFTPERIRERKSAALSLFNLRRSQLFAAKRRLAAAHSALGLPVEIEPAAAAAPRRSRKIAPEARPQAATP